MSARTHRRRTHSCWNVEPTPPAPRDPHRALPRRQRTPHDHLHQTLAAHPHPALPVPQPTGHPLPLTRWPVLEPNTELLALTKALSRDSDQDEAAAWTASFREWEARHDGFLKHRAYARPGAPRSRGGCTTTPRSQRTRSASSDPTTGTRRSSHPSAPRRGSGRRPMTPHSARKTATESSKDGPDEANGTREPDTHSGP